MRRIIIFITVLTFISITIPSAFILRFGVYKIPSNENITKINVYVKEEDKVVEMSKAQYLKEVVAAEMPASFEAEALKAQAVAARSYLTARSLSYRSNGYPAEHKGADVCTDSKHCKAWISESKRKESWGKDAKKNWDKINLAVESTKNEVIFYENEIISAVFHSTSSGKTENSKDVWGGDKPYLVSVESPGEENAPNYTSTLTIPKHEFIRIAEENIEGVDFSGELTGEIVRSDTGGIISIVIGKVPVKGTVFRALYCLKSTNVNIIQTDDAVTFNVKGYGHGVGMSQYGANAMAKNGATYKEILTHYYQGTNISEFKE